MNDRLPKNEKASSNKEKTNQKVKTVKIIELKKWDQYNMLPPVTEHVSLHSKSLRKNMARASGGANDMHTISWGGGGAHTEKIQKMT